MRAGLLRFAVLGLILTVLLAACTEPDTGLTPEESQRLGAATGSTPAQAPRAVPSEKRQEFSGVGDDVVLLDLQPGLVLFDVTHNGTSNIALWLRGQSDDLLVNEIGRYSGTVAAGVGGGSFILDVSADGSWRVTVREPRNQRPSAEQVFGGVGDGVSDFVRLDEGLHIVSAKHVGDSNFAIWLYGEDGSREDLIVNDIGDYEGGNSVRIRRGGVYIFVVTADGPWALSVQ